MKTMKRITKYIIFIALIFASCMGEKNKTLTGRDSIFVNFQADLMIIQEENRLEGKDSAYLTMRTDSLYREYSITPAQYDFLIRDLSKNLIDWREFQTKVMHRLESLNQSGSGFVRNTQ